MEECIVEDLGIILLSFPARLWPYSWGCSYFTLKFCYLDLCPCCPCSPLTVLINMRAFDFFLDFELCFSLSSSSADTPADLTRVLPFWSTLPFPMASWELWGDWWGTSGGTLWVEVVSLSLSFPKCANSWRTTELCRIEGSQSQSTNKN